MSEGKEPRSMISPGLALRLPKYGAATGGGGMLLPDGVSGQHILPERLYT